MYPGYRLLNRNIYKVSSPPKILGISVPCFVFTFGKFHCSAAGIWLNISGFELTGGPGTGLRKNRKVFPTVLGAGSLRSGASTWVLVSTPSELQGRGRGCSLGSL